MITSTSNARVKYLVNLKKKRKFRDTEGMFLVEGLRMFQEVPGELLAGLYVTEGFLDRHGDLVQRKAAAGGVLPEVLSDSVFAYVSDTRTPQGVLCIVRQMNGTAERIAGGEASGRPPFLLALDRLQDPGNLGTIVRAAEGAGVTGILMSADCVDIYNPKVIRSTMGSVFRVPFCYADDLPGALMILKRQGIRCYAAHLDGKNAYDGEDYRAGSAFLIGNEGNGLSDAVARCADCLIRIPMCGQVESLNAAVAATVLMFEAARQRRNG